MFLALLYFAVALPFYLAAFVACSIVVLIIGMRIHEPFKGVCTCTAKLKGKTALITGGNSGIGLETARDFAQRGAKVIIASRNEKQSLEAVTDIINSTGNQNVHYKRLDLGSFEDVRKFAKEFNEKESRLDILVNNAGCAGVPNKTTKDGIDVVLQVNHFGPFLLTQLLLDKMKASGPSRVIIVSSLAHKFARLKLNDLTQLKNPGRLFPYANSKLLNVMWARALAKRLPSNVTVNSCHPGVVQTNIFKSLPWPIEGFVVGLVGLILKSPKEGAQTTIHLGVAPELEHATGGYYVDCKPASISWVAAEDKLVEKIWEKSCQVTQT